MNCEDEYTLTAYADGRCSAAERERARRHLQACAACRGQLRWLQAMKAALAGLPAPRAPEDLLESLRRQARESARRKSARLRRGGWRGWLAPRRAAGAGLAAGLAAALLLAVRGFMPAETVSLDDMLAAHRAYALTMPLASRETLLSGLADALAGRRP